LISPRLFAPFVILHLSFGSGDKRLDRHSFPPIFILPFVLVLGNHVRLSYRICFETEHSRILNMILLFSFLPFAFSFVSRGQRSHVSVTSQ
jgi:hypothetical protein